MENVKYLHEDEVHNTKAAAAFLPVLFEFLDVKSVIDIGCGLGTWLKVFAENGATEIIGVDGPNLDKSRLAIPIENFIEHDLRQPLNLLKRFDLTICLEVAEHLPKDNADHIVEMITSFSDRILFSAALPMQGGQNHINEQPFSYWVTKFNHRGFTVNDVFRQRIWDDERIDWWYRQNLFLVTRDSSVNQLNIRDYYHPVKFSYLVQDNNQYFDEINNLKDVRRVLEDNLTQAQVKMMQIISGQLPIWAALKIFLKSVYIKMKGNKVSKKFG